ncbi:MAG TPA: plastocyanin/azurin family copper-binding protein [Thermoplasmata archaeon]|nr:plastocyanin/azurin family copper-binding protein [Thermoplasmata archaeon]
MDRIAAFAVLAVLVVAAGAGALLYRASIAPADVRVSIADYAFSPSNVTVRAGTTVQWLNYDGVGHTVTFGEHDETGSGMGSGMMGHMGSFSMTFTEPGTYAYHCDPHPYMTGIVIVAG